MKRYYIDDPLTATELEVLVDLVGGDPADMVRGDLADPSRDGVVAHLLAHPDTMQRPIGVIGDKAIIARPEDLILTILD